MTNKNSVRGFTLLGVLVGLFMIATVSLGAAGLLTRAERLAQVARSEFVATNLSREGLELVRSVRDTNWFTDSDRSRWFKDDMCTSFTLDAKGVRRNHDPGLPDNARLYIHNNNGEWLHDNSNATETAFSRVLEADCTEKDGAPAFVLVTSRVSWQERGQTREVVLKEKLYNWLP